MTLAILQPLHAWHPLSKVTIALGVVAAAVLWWTDDPKVSADIGTAAASVRAATPNEGGTAADRPLELRVVHPLESFHAMVERPLFNTGRRPKEPPPLPVAIVPIAELPPLRFVGSIERNGLLRALISDGTAVRSFSIGEAIDGWRVLEIDHRRLLLGSADDRLELQLLE